uniref:CRM domain-containing protein n=1 Tax=Davidia involucrata TaxID=16924 RepID=A0A5B7BZ66_DAVIN
MLNDIHNHWKHAEAVRVKCMGVPTVDMKNVCTQLEDKTFGKIIHRHGGLLVLYRGRNYVPKRRPVIPLMLWKPHEPIYPRLIKTTIDGLSIEETKEMRKRGLAVPALTKLAKNGYYGSLVPMLRDAFLTDELVRIDCQGLEKSDYKKIGCKLRDMVPCVLVTFEKEQIVVWRGENYKPVEDGPFLTDRESFDNPESDLVNGGEEPESSNDGNNTQDF